MIKMFPQARAAIKYLVADGRYDYIETGSLISIKENVKDIVIYAADAEKRDILRLYREDIMKINAQYRSKVLAIYDQIPGLLSEHEKRVVFKRVQNGSYAEQYEETFFGLLIL